MAPLCRRVFHLPGEAGLAILLGFSSGFPTGASVCASLIEKNTISKKEAERLICFTNNAGPLFIMITVCTAILNMPQAGILLAGIHYGISLLYGIISARFAPMPPSEKRTVNADYAPESLGLLLKNAAMKAISQISLIGCYLVFFSLLCGILAHTGVFEILGKLLSPVLLIAGLPADCGEIIFCGITEMTLGIAKSSTNPDFAHSFALCAFFLSFGGISVQTQVYAMTASHRLNFKPYLLSCIIKGICAYCIALPVGKSLALSAATAAKSIPAINLPTIFLFALFCLWLFYLKGRK